MKDNVSINPTLENAPEKLRNVRQLELDVSDGILDFVEYMAEIAKHVSPYMFVEPFIPETMLNLAMEAMNNIESESAFPSVPKYLKDEFAEIIWHRTDLFKVVDKMASVEFAEKFRDLGKHIL